MQMVSNTTISGQQIACAEGIDMIAGSAANLPADVVWAPHGAATNDRYTTRAASGAAFDETLDCLPLRREWSFTDREIGICLSKVDW